jgi:superfamily II DNA or RNA helicase
MTRSEIQKEALEAIGLNQLAGVAIGTGGGKTLLGLKDMVKHLSDDALFLVVAPRIDIQKEWVNNAVNHGYETLLDHIEFTTYLSLSKNHHQYDKIYLDECHSLTFSHDEWLKKYVSLDGNILGLSGTYPTYMQSEKGIMCNNYCPVVYEYTADEGVDAGMLNDYKIYVHLLELSNEKNITTRKGLMSEKASYSMWCNILEDNPSSQNSIMRMKTMQEYKSKLNYAKKLLDAQQDKTLIFGNTVAQAEILCKNSYHSKNGKKGKENLKYFIEGAIDKLSVVSMISEGVTVPDLKTGIIMHAYANERKFAQKLGRFLRLNPNDRATIHLLCYKNTVDEIWCRQALKAFNPKKIFIWPSTRKI